MRKTPSSDRRSARGRSLEAPAHELRGAPGMDTFVDLTALATVSGDAARTARMVGFVRSVRSTAIRTTRTTSSTCRRS
eukprot:5175736-Prymnesium_polylepis.2